MEELFIGSVITVYSRQLKLVEYGDLFTRQRFESKRQRTFAMIKPDAYMSTGKIIDSIYQAGFMISKLKMTRFSPETAGQFYGEHKGKPFYNDLMNFVTSDVVTGLEIVAENAVEKWRQVIGPTRSSQAKQSAPDSIRARFGTDDTKNAVHGSDSGPSWKRECDLFFGSKQASTAAFSSCTLCIIKPHAVLKGDAGKIIDTILEEGFEISAMEMFTLDKPTAEEFFEVYKGVVPEFVPIIDHMTTGPCIALEVR
jgi:nucleoside-diphosphate kinase